MRNPIIKNSGFTLIEIIIAISILSGIIFVVSMFGLDIFDLQIFLGDIFVVQQEITATLTEMGIEVRAMGPSANGSYPVESASTTSFVYYSDMDGDGSFERIRYFVVGNVLRKGVIKPVGNPATYPLADEVTRDVVRDLILPPVADQPLFSYHDGNYTGTQEPMSEPVDINRIRLIKVVITADKTPQDNLGRFDYSSLMLIRNLRNI
ncbi:MAG: prepilin-type N-terminal cleavage/methylation domain-containing protein [Candidatus Yanofskybacteria bacterium]|nr:prepilin-type N-terminal cleavage/methylation domain-containing protein [Candidatus Yanofskybacteria bacterium]